METNQTSKKEKKKNTRRVKVNWGILNKAQKGLSMDKLKNLQWCDPWRLRIHRATIESLPNKLSRHTRIPFPISSNSIHCLDIQNALNWNILYVIVQLVRTLYYYKNGYLWYLHSPSFSSVEDWGKSMTW